MSGLKWSFAVNGIAWYLSAMFLALLMIYPIVRKHFDSFAYVYGPVLSILLLAYLSLTYGSLNLTTSSETFVQPGLIRALAEITLGVTSFAVSKKLSELRLSGKVCGVFGIMEAACYIFVLAMAFIERDGHSDFILLAFLFAGVTISFSQQSILTKHIHLKFGNILAKIAMLIFLNQRCWMYLIPLFNLDSYFKNLLGIYFVCLYIISYHILDVAIRLLPV